MESDEQILQLLRKGEDHKALAMLYRHLPGIRRMIRFHGGRRDEAEDIFQEGLIIFCRKAREAEFRLSSGAYSYLHSVCRYLWLEELRRQKRQPVVDDDASGEADPGPAAAVDNEQRFRIAERIVDGLAGRCRELLQLFYISRLRLSEIAAKMGYGSEQSAKNSARQCHCRKMLRSNDCSLSMLQS